MPSARTLTVIAAAVFFLVSSALLLRDTFVEHARPEIAAAATGGTAPQRYVLILVLGQSTSKWNFEAYGYPYDTTPRMEKLGRKIVWLRDAVSAHSGAGLATQHLFLRETKRIGGLASAQSLLDRLDRAGVATAWYSSRWAPASGDSSPHAIAAGARMQKYFSSDDEMIAEVLRHLESSTAPSFLAAHLTLARGEYCRNLPLAVQGEFSEVVRGKNFFGNFRGSQRDVNCYDAAIKHVDRLLGSVIEAADNANAPVVVVYAADHGADAFGFSGQHSAPHSARHVEIPVAVYANDAAKRVEPSKWDALTRNAGKPFLGSWLHETILDLYDLTTQYRLGGHLSLFSAGYAPEPRTVFMQTAPLSYDGFKDFDRKDNLNRTRINLSSWQSRRSERPKHVFAHRLDSELALIEAIRYFRAFELDIVFDQASGRFNVHHPPDLETGFTLERALRIVSRTQAPVLWLDWKNPGNENFDRALHELARVARQSGLVDKIIVETEPNFIDPRLRRIRDFGFRHSYYMPTEVATRCSGQAIEGCAKEHVRLVGVVRQFSPDCLSFDARGMRFATKLAADTNTGCLLAWDLDIDSARRDFLSRVDKYTNVDGLIVRFPTKFFY